jgi:conjugal transfer ATP-binding protein TraC
MPERLSALPHRFGTKRKEDREEEAMKDKALCEDLQVWGFEDGFTVFKDNSIGFGLELSTLDISCSDDEAINILSVRIKDFINGLPSGIDFQFVQDIAGSDLSLFKSISSQRNQNPIVQELVKTRLAKFSELSSRGELVGPVLRLFVRLPFVSDLTDKPKFFHFGKVDLQGLSENRLRSEIDRAERVRQSFSAGLATLGIETNAIKPDALVRVIYEQWNPTRPLGVGQYDPEDIRDSVLFSDVNKSVSGFTIGEMHHGIISLKMLPDQTFASMAQSLQNLPFDSRLFLSVHMPDQAKEIQNLQTQRRMAYALVHGKKGVSDIESGAKLGDLEDLLCQMIASGEKVFYVSLNIVLRSRSLDKLNELVGRTLLTLREFGGAEGTVESLGSYEIFRELSIPNARGRERSRRIKTSNLKDLIPLFAPWKGFENPAIVLRTRSGGLFSFDPFAKQLANANQVISGGSGSGKSYLTNLMINQMLRENPKVFILDIGGSYQKTCEILDGQYIPLGSSIPLSINPFDLSSGEKNPSDQKIKFLVGLVELMTKEEGEKRLGRFERAEIESSILEVYRSISNPRLRDLKSYLEKNQNPEISKLAKILKPWCGETPFGKFVDHPTSVEFEKRIVCFDLKNLETYPDLQAVCLFLITDLVLREVQKDRSVMKFLIFDESWKLLESDVGSTFIAEVFRTFRKYYASCVAISQNIDDFAKSRAANAIMPNSSIKWILKQKGADQDRLKATLNLNEREMELISSLAQERGKFSEAFLICEDRRSVVSIESTPFEYWLATTDPKDLAFLEEMKRQKPEATKLQLLMELAVSHPFGYQLSGVKQ